MIVKKLLCEPWRIIASTKLQRVMTWVPDTVYLKCLYRASLGTKLDFKRIEQFNEKLQYLKIYDRHPRYIQMVDKYEAKKYVGALIGEEHIIKTYGVWDKFEAIDFSQLPERFVLKCTHDSAGLVICKDKSTFDIKAAKKRLNWCLRRNFYYSGREWPYKHVKPRIIAEEYMEDSYFHELRDYKFFTFNGIPKIMHLVTNRGNQNEPTYGDFFDMEYHHIDLTMGHDNAPNCPEKPHCFDQMKQFAKLLAEDTSHLRVDFYEVDGRVYFGELTFFQDSGFADIQPPEWNKKLGDWIRLPNRTQENEMV